MIDYIIWHETAEAALADPLLSAWRTEGEGWDTSRVIPTVFIYRVTGTETSALPGGGGTFERSIRTHLAGHYMVVALDGRDAGLDGAPQVMLIADRENGLIMHTITTAEDLATLNVEPTFAGSSYPFGAPVLAG
ncbi:MAG: hypothetical protein B7Z30_15495 [Rhizobiales bacterium 12-68-15]|nr:MAG: hypothetical protein B7Z30_15495 [Rhizobiales bacterium 12-68-15]